MSNRKQSMKDTLTSEGAAANEKARNFFMKSLHDSKALPHFALGDSGVSVKAEKPGEHREHTH